MAKEILVYGSIFNFTADFFLREVEEAKGEDLVVRVNSNGGGVEAGFGMIGKFKEHPKNKLVKVDAAARSMMAFFTAASDEAECLNVTEFLFHRAAFDRWIENDDELFTDERKAQLVRINSFLREILEAKVDVPKFESITGVTLDELFSLESRVDAVLDADQAKEVGLVDRITNITSSIESDMEARSKDYIAAAYSFNSGETTRKPFAPAASQDSNKNDNSNKTDKTMNLQELKTKHPDVYAQVIEEGVIQERDRVEAFMVFVGVDAKAVKEGIEGGKNPSQKFFAEMNLKQASATVVEENEKEGAENVDTPEAKAEAKRKAEEEEKFVAEAKKNSKFAPKA